MYDLASRLWGPLWLRNVLGVAAVCAFSLALWVISPNFRFQSGPKAISPAGDFLAEYVAGYMIWHDPQKLYDTPTVRRMQHDPAVVGQEWDRTKYQQVVYPPAWFLATSPLALLPISKAAAVWLAIRTAALIAAFALLAWAYPKSAPLAVALPLSVLFTPTLESLAMGQKGPIMLLLFTATLLLLENKRPFTAGLVFGLLVFKPQVPLVMGLVMLLKGQWRFVAGSAVTVALFVLACFSLGTEVFSGWLGAMAETRAYLNDPSFPLDRLHSWYGFFRLLLPMLPVTVVQLLGLVFSLATLAVLIPLFRGPLEFGTVRFHVQYAVLLLATVLTSPHLLSYDQCILVLAYCLLVNAAFHESQPFGDKGRLVVWLCAFAGCLVSISTALAYQTRFHFETLLLAGLVAAAAWCCKTAAAGAKAAT